MLTVWTVAILYKRRSIHRDAHGMATAVATIMREAAARVVSPRHVRRQWWTKELTDIAPYRCSVNSVAPPHNGINTEIEAGERCPEHVETCASIPRVEMPR